MKQKTKGISLIVLVITIIIIIILAGAVILSLSNSNVINKAKSGVMQTDLSTVKEQIRNKMMDNDFNGTDIKIGTQLWDSYYTLSVSQLQEIGITTKSDYIYNYNTGDLSVKQNNEYVTPEEIYPTDPQGAYIQGYLGIKGLEVDPVTTPQKQALINNYTNGEIKVMLVKYIDLDQVDQDDNVYYDLMDTMIKPPIFSTSTNNSGYFRLENITPGQYTLIIKDYINVFPIFKNITVTSSYAKTVSTKESPIRLSPGEYTDGMNIDGEDTSFVIVARNTNSTDIRKYDVNKDGIIDNLDVTIVGNNSNWFRDAYANVTTF